MIEKFKELKTGIRRVILVGTLPGASLIGGILGTLNEYRLSSEEFLGWSVFAGIPIYWICVFVGIWVYDGFKNEEK